MDRDHALIAARAKRKTHEQRHLPGNLKGESFKMISSKDTLEVEDVDSEEEEEDELPL